MDAAKKKLVITILFSIFLVSAVLVGSTFVDVFIQDWKVDRMCNEAYSKDGQTEVQACLRREADRQVRSER